MVISSLTILLILAYPKKREGMLKKILLKGLKKQFLYFFRISEAEFYGFPDSREAFVPTMNENMFFTFALNYPRELGLMFSTVEGILSEKGYSILGSLNIGESQYSFDIQKGSEQFTLEITRGEYVEFSFLIRISVIE